MRYRPFAIAIAIGIGIENAFDAIFDSDSDPDSDSDRFSHTLVSYNVESVNKDWTPLQPGESIGVVALSGPVDTEKLDAGLEILRGWGHPVIEAPNLRTEATYLAGGDDDRLAGLEMVVGSGARVIIAARGGYGASRLLERIDWRDLSKRGICVVGFSDLLSLLGAWGPCG